MEKVPDVYLDKALRGWIVNTAMRERWRLPAWYDVADLIQDGYICYAKCRNKYALNAPSSGHTHLNVNSPTNAQRRHFMALVKTAFYNHIFTLAANKGHEAPLSENDDAANVADLEKRLPPQSEEASLAVALASMPAELQETLERLVKDGIEGTEFLRSHLYWRGSRLVWSRNKLRETTREFWGRVVGDPDFPQRLARYLQA